MKKPAVILSALLGCILTANLAFSLDQLCISLKNREGNNIGHAHLSQATEGVVIKVFAKDIEPGWHAFHLHSIGDCSSADFKSSGGHFNPTAKHHGVHNDGGRHLGDLPNVYVPESGELITEVFANGVYLNDGKTGLLDEDGSAIVMHAGPDDYKSDPAGAAGARIVCGAIEP